MVKLTTELIMNSYQFINPVKDRELDLRGYKIPLIENMGATLDQFDTIDFSDNDIRKIDGFAYLKRLKNIIFNNNAIIRIADNLDQCLPNLESLILTGNQIQELGDLDPLASLPKLKMLSLLHNPVASKEHYRLYVAHKIPQVRVLDFRKIKLKEYEAAKALFKGKEGKELKKKLVKKSNQFVPGEGLDNRRANGHSQEDMWRIRKAISEATSLEEVEHLTKLLQAGQIPNKDRKKKSGTQNGEENIEEFDDDDDDDNNEASVRMEYDYSVHLLFYISQLIRICPKNINYDNWSKQVNSSGIYYIVDEMICSSIDIFVLDHGAVILKQLLNHF